MLSWQAGAVYKPRENGSVYLSYGTSFDPSFDSGNAGAALSGEPDSSSNVNLEPKESRNYELGAKWDLIDGTLGLTAACSGRRRSTPEPGQPRANQRLGAGSPDHPAVVQLTGVYHNLLRRWADI